MSLLERAKSAFYSPSYTPQLGRSTSLYNQGDMGWASGLSPVIRQFADCFTEDAILKDPRQYLMVYRAMGEKLGFVSTAYQRKRDLIGVPEIVSEDEAWAQEANAMLNEIRYCGEQSGDFHAKRGFGAIIHWVVQSTFTDGQTFVSLIDRNGDLLNRATQKAEYLRVHDSARFNFQEVLPDHFELWYTRQGRIIVMRENPAFMPVTFRDSRYNWGLPLSYECETTVSMLLTAMGNRQGAHYRLGNPTSLTHIGFEVNKEVNPGVAKMLVDIAKENADAAAASYRRAVAESNRTFKPRDITLVMPIDSKIETKMIGEGARAITEYVPEIMFSVKLVVMPLNYPAVLLGLDGAGGGIGSEEFRFSADAAMADAETHRIRLEDQFVRPLTNQLMVRNSRRIPKYEIQWNGSSLLNDKVIAETRKTNAEALKFEIEAFTMARSEMGPENAMMVAEELEKEWKSYTPPPDPAPTL